MTAQLRAKLLDEQVEAGLRGDFKRGWEIALQLQELVPQCRRSAFNRAIYEMMRGNLLEGFRCLDNGRWEKCFGDQPLPTSKPIYHGEDLQNKNVLLCSEGGLGDEMINVRFAKNFADRGAKVTVTCDPSLMSVFARVPGVSAVVAHRSAPDVYHDYWVPAMSAGSVLNINYSDLSGEPYFLALSQYQEKWESLLQRATPRGAPRIGLRFYGNPNFEHEQHRRFPKEGLINSLEGRSWINLQKEETNLPIENWEDTLGLISQLDLVITSCTSVAHASAALGKETWVLVPIMPYYVWALPGEKSPWYNSVRLFRQTQFGSWEQVFKEISSALKKRGL